jgi:uncharacterized protein YqeY
MNLKQTLTEKMKAAMKSGDKEGLGTLRMLLSEIKNFEIDNGEQDDAGVQKLVARSIKQWKDALVDYQKGGREDLIKEAEARIAFLGEFLPAQASEDDIKKVIQEVVSAMPNPSVGPVIGQVKAKLGNSADGGTVARLVNEALAK